MSSTANSSDKMKYILVTGGVISGVGKGVIASSIGALLNCCDIIVTSIKIDPYINNDAGTFSPYEHGEVFVLDDGAEVDLDLGNYEQFMDVTLHRDNNITTGKIYKQVMDKERRGDYLGKTVQTVPHITDAIQEWVERVAVQPVRGNLKPEVCIIELGGTIGDMESMAFVDALSQLQEKNQGDFCVVHVPLVLMHHGELKTKPAQNSVRELLKLGLRPDIIMCRSEVPMSDDLKLKISTSCRVKLPNVISVPDSKSIYHVPLEMEANGVLAILKHQLRLPEATASKQMLKRWRALAFSDDKATGVVKIALVGKYTKLNDAYASVSKALQHAASALDLRLELKFIEASNLEVDTEKQDKKSFHEAMIMLIDCDGVIVPGGFGSRGMEGKIRASKWCRENNKPFLGICLGMQAAVIEFARNVVDLKDANTTEIDAKTTNPLVVDMPEHHPGDMGGTMRLGRRTTVFNESINSTIKKLYGSPKSIDERHRHRYEINTDYVERLEAKGLNFVGTDEANERMEIVELQHHKYYVGVQYHPEYLSRPLKPSPPFLGLILAATNKLDRYLSEGCRLSPRVLSDNSSGSLNMIPVPLFRYKTIRPKIESRESSNGFQNGHTNGVAK